MALSRADLLLHPVRLRIVLEAAGDDLTAGELSRRLPDVPQATLYRHLATLTEAGVLQVVAERRIRGGVERTFRLLSENAGLGPADAADLTPEEHLTGMITFVGALVASFARYLSRPDADPGTVGYRQAALWLTDQEMQDLREGLRTALTPYLALEAAPGRRRVRLSTIVIPDAWSADPQPTGSSRSAAGRERPDAEARTRGADEPPGSSAPRQ